MNVTTKIFCRQFLNETLLRFLLASVLLEQHWSQCKNRLTSSVSSRVTLDLPYYITFRTSSKQRWVHLSSCGHSGVTLVTLFTPSEVNVLNPHYWSKQGHCFSFFLIVFIFLTVFSAYFIRKLNWRHHSKERLLIERRTSTHQSKQPLRSKCLLTMNVSEH